MHRDQEQGDFDRGPRNDSAIKCWMKMFGLWGGD